MKLILLGAPGAGKGTQADLLNKKLGIPTISTGNILRSAVANGTPTGLKAKAFMDAGALVPDEVIIGIIKERLREPDCKNGYILDGVPRTIAQAQALEDEGVGIDAALNLEVDDDVILKRMSGRRACPSCGATFHVTGNPPKVAGICDNCGTELTIRKDDDPETVKNRLEIYHKVTEPLLEFYQKKGIYKSVKCTSTPEDTAKLVLKTLGIAE